MGKRKSSPRLATTSRSMLLLTLSTNHPDPIHLLTFFLKENKIITYRTFQKSDTLCEERTNRGTNTHDSALYRTWSRIFRPI